MIIAAAIVLTHLHASKVHAVYETAPIYYHHLTDQMVDATQRRTFNKRKDIALKMEVAFREHGIDDDKQIIAVWANAWHESTWNPSVNKYGLFQIMSGRHANLTNPDVNISTLLTKEPFASRVKAWDAKCEANPNATAGDYAYWFAAQVEVCAKSHREPRRRTANKWWSRIMNT